jgi:HYR domain
MATDTSLNSGSCSFTVTIDNQAPSITCPANITVQPPGNQCTTTVNYPNPVVGDDQPGVVVVCAPPSGSIFPPGVTTVNCTATDRSGNTSACSFTITNIAGPLLSGSVSLNITLGPGEPVRKPGKSRPANCSDCVEEFADFRNTGCGNAVVMLRSINRVGEDVTNGRITNTDDSAFFSVSVIGDNGQSTPLPAGSSFTLLPGQGIRLRITFRPVIPLYANRNEQLAASQVLPSIVRARLSFTTSNPFADFPVDVIARVATDVKMLHPTNPRKQKTVFFQRSGDEFRITYGVFDSDLNVQRARYEFFDANGRAVGEAFEVDLTEAIRGQDLVTGQSFTVTQRFAGALSNPTIAAIRVTVSDGGSSDSATGQLGASANAAPALSSLLRSWGSAIILPDLRIESSEPK